MKIKKAVVGDWICSTNDVSKGEFTIAHIIGYRYDNLAKINLDNNTIIENKYGGSSDLKEGYSYTLNKQELDKVMKLIVKLNIIKGLR